MSSQKIYQTKAMSDLLIIQDTNYSNQFYHEIGDGKNVTAFCSPRVALIINNDDWLTETATPISNLYSSNPIKIMEKEHPATQIFSTPSGLEVMGAALLGLENLVSAFVNLEITPKPLVLNPYNDRPIRVEVSYLGNAGGLGSMGRSGIALGPGFIKEYLNSIIDPKGFNLWRNTFWQLDNPIDKIPPIYYQHAMGYELCRNYIPTEWFDIGVYFNYYMSTSNQRYDNPADIQLDTSFPGVLIPNGIIDTLGVFLVADMNPIAGLCYADWSLQNYLIRNIAHLEMYVNNEDPWEKTFLYAHIEWAPTMGLDNIYAGLLAILWGSYGRTDFLKNFLAHVPSLPPTNSDVKIALNNFFITSCYGAKLNLITYFWVYLRWTMITDESKNTVQKLFGDPITTMPSFKVISAVPFTPVLATSLYKPHEKIPKESNEKLNIRCLIPPVNPSNLLTDSSAKSDILVNTNNLVKCAYSNNLSGLKPLNVSAVSTYRKIDVIDIVIISILSGLGGLGILSYLYLYKHNLITKSHYSSIFIYSYMLILSTSLYVCIKELPYDSTTYGVVLSTSSYVLFAVGIYIYIQMKKYII